MGDFSFGTEGSRPLLLFKFVNVASRLGEVLWKTQLNWWHWWHWEAPTVERLLKRHY